jgi:hypothetical protein
MKTRALAPDEPTPSSRGSIDLSDGLEETNKDVLPRNPSAPDDPTHCRAQLIIGKFAGGVLHWSSSVREPQRLSDVGGPPDELMLLKSKCRFIRWSTFQ